MQVRANAIGVLISEDYNLPFSIKVNLKNIGGPSAGLIFSLAVIEKLTKEDLVRSRNIAGTGTITPGGKVGPIGGVEEKLIGAARAGVTLFLAPAENCPDIRHIPKGLQVVPVENLTEAIAALRERDRERLPMCG
ncbi:MAG: S16 family serine protease [Actinomycetota bacterium]